MAKVVDHMSVGMLCLSLIAGWLVNLVADSAPERRPLHETWLWAIYQLPHRWQVWLGATRGGVPCPPHRPWRYALVGAMALLLGWLSEWRMGAGSLASLLLAIQTWFLLAVAVIDLEHRRVLNRMLLPALPVVLLLQLWMGWPVFLSALGGGVVGFGFFLLLALIRPGAMGMGDVKLAGLLGLALGWQGCLMAIIICLLSGGVAAAAILVRNRFRPGQTLAYAPYLVLGAWVTLFFGAIH